MTLQTKPEKTDNAAEMRNRRSGTKRLGCMTHSLRHSRFALRNRKGVVNAHFLNNICLYRASRQKFA